MADSSQEGLSQSRNPSPARDRSSDGESDGATKPAARASSGTRCTGPSCSRWAMTFKADEPWTHHRLCGTHLVCTPSGAVCAVCSDWSAEIWKAFKAKDLQFQKKRDYRAMSGKTRSQSPAKAREPVPPVPSPIVLDSPDPSGAEAPHGKKKDVRRTSRPSRTHKKKKRKYSSPSSSESSSPGSSTGTSPDRGRRHRSPSPRYRHHSQHRHHSRHRSRRSRSGERRPTASVSATPARPSGSGLPADGALLEQLLQQTFSRFSTAKTALPPFPYPGQGPAAATAPAPAAVAQLPHRPAPSSDRTGHERRIVHSPSVEIPVRTSGEHDVSGPKSQTTHPPAPVLCPEPMVPGHAGHNPDTPDPECPDPARVVARPHQLDFRSSFLNSRPGTDNSDRCFILRMGRSPGRPDGFWRLARPMEEQAHQLAGTPGSVANSETFSGPGSKPSSGSPIRQFHHGLLHQQAGRDTLPDPMPPGPGHVGMVRPTGHCTSSSPSSRDTQRPSGRTVQGEVLPDGVVPTPSDAQSPVLNLGDSHGRPVRNTEEQETTDVLLPIQGTRVERGQCPDSELGRSVRVCIPPHSTAPQSAQEDQTPPNSGGDPSGPILAEPNLVPPTNPDVSGLPQEVARQVEPPEELRDGGIVPRTQQAPIGCVENLRQSYRAQGFSEAVAKLASCGKRPSTYRVYDSRLAHYSRWCTTRSLDPNSAPVQQIAEFLSDLAKMTEPGHSLSYNTIVGYRTAIGAIHTGFSEGVTVSNHPVLQSVMKGIFNSKATTRQLKPVWDLPKVLGHLSQAPLEPMARASLRNLSVKTAFLIQLASGRRGGWIHACRMDPAYLRKESGGFTFLSSLILDKNQSAHFTPEPVFIAALSDHSPDDKLHCPIRALKWYLDKTKTIRGQEKALFISSKEPHSKAAKLTIAGWVKEAIAGTYRDLPLEERLAMNIRAHDTRGVAASWARAAGVSIPEIMNAAAWSTPVTFAKFYLKDLPNQKGKFGNAVLSTAGTFKP